jgi:hypothetical protein
MPDLRGLFARAILADNRPHVKAENTAGKLKTPFYLAKYPARWATR